LGTRKLKKIAIYLLFIILYMPSQSWGGNARGYKPFPDGTFLVCTYFKHFSANKLYADSRKVSNDFYLSSNIAIFRPVYYKKIGKALYGSGDFIVNPQVFMMFGDKDLGKGGSSLSDSGLLDPMILATFWFVNAPEKTLWIGFSPCVTIPLGNYHSDRLLNLGENRWTFKPEIGVVKGLGEGLFVDFVVNGKLYTGNDEFFTGVKKVKKSQEPLLGLETHLSYNVTKKWFVSLDYFYFSGGETEVDGEKMRDEKDNHALGFSMFWGVGGSQQLMFEYLNNFAVENGTAVQTFGMRWACFF